MTRAVFEVWGDPIAHSRSPAMHAAAYAFLGLDWTYGRRRVPAGEFGATFAALGDTHRGLSVTFPLKQEAAAACDTLDASALRTGAVNTVLRGAAGIRGWNTDVGGIVDALAEHGITAVSRGRVVGAGATATSALVALCTLGADHVEIIARRPGAADALQSLAASLGVDATVRGMSVASSRTRADVTLATLPGGAEVDETVADGLADAGGLLFDVVYGRGRTALEAAWQRAGNPTTDGLGMLLHQAVRQVRIFASGGQDAPLEREDAMVAVMRRALVGD